MRKILKNQVASKCSQNLFLLNYYSASMWGQYHICRSAVDYGTAQ